jgi:hypothetical protein
MASITQALHGVVNLHGSSMASSCACGRTPETGRKWYRRCWNGSCDDQH